MPRTRTTLAEDLAAARAVLPAFAERIARLVAGIGDPRTATPLPGWNAGDIAAHLGQACTAYAAAAAGELDVAYFGAIMPEHPDLSQRVAVLNATTLSKAEPGAYLAVPGQIRDSAAALAEAVRGRDPEEPCLIPWFGTDKPLTLAAVVGLFLSESALHGLDLARATGRQWAVPSSVARLVISLAYPDIIPRTVDAARAANVHAAVRLHVRGGVTIGLDIDGPRVEARRDPGPGPTDCHIWLDPVAFLLTASGRSSQLRQLAAGRMVSGGRKPWLGLTVARLFAHP